MFNRVTPKAYVSFERKLLFRMLSCWAQGSGLVFVILHPEHKQNQ
jgi:hypothetical protein